MRIKRTILAISLISFILTFTVSALAQDDSAALQQKGLQLLREKKYEEAITVYEQILQKNPDDEGALYNTACAYSLLGKTKKAIEYLEKAVEAGFIDFEQIESDPDLDNIRKYSGEPGRYQKLIREKDKTLKDAARKKIEQLKKEFGESYTYEIDDKRKLIYASKTSKELLDKIQDYLNKYADVQRKHLFKNKPPYYLTILCPTNEDFKKRVPNPNIGGFYQHTSRTLFCKDTGSVLRHEFTHALHFADISSRKQEHPIWLVEGLATCFEDSDVSASQVTSKYNRRIDQLKGVITGTNYVPWQDLMKMDHRSFMAKAGICYAEVRGIFYWLDKTKQLPSFYQLYLKHNKEDVSGIKTLEELFKASFEEIEKTWQAWIIATEPPLAPKAKKEAFLGVTVEESVGGMIISQVEPDSPAAQAGLKKGDVILRIGVDKVTSYDEFVNAIRERKPGQLTPFFILRDNKEQTVTVKFGERKKTP